MVFTKIQGQHPNVSISLPQLENQGTTLPSAKLLKCTSSEYTLIDLNLINHRNHHHHTAESHLTNTVSALPSAPSASNPRCHRQPVLLCPFSKTTVLTALDYHPTSKNPLHHTATSPLTMRKTRFMQSPITHSSACPQHVIQPWTTTTDEPCTRQL